ncbi:MAG: RICIN domain-containing protein, partial [Clostridia bacterium]|nr:RICIN domain-containing protein [Clostridia bacterium]
MKNRRKTRIISLMLAVITIMVVLTSNASAETYYLTNITEGDYFICPSSSSNYAIDVINNSHASGAGVHLYSKFSNTNEAQIFTIRHYSGYWYKIINKASGLCLNVPYANSVNGQQLWVHSPDNTAASLWRFAKAPDGNYVIQNQLGRVIDLDNNIVRDGSRIHLWDLHDGASCRWRL